MRAIKSVQKSLATEFYGACSSERNKVASCKRFDVITINVVNVPLHQLLINVSSILFSNRKNLKFPGVGTFNVYKTSLRW